MSPARKGDEVSLRAWAAELEAAAQIARALAGTAFMPESHRRYHADERGQPLNGKDGRAIRLDHEATTATAAAAIMRGAELGLPPGAALGSIAVINNTPALSALALRAILQNAGHDIWVVPESNATRAIVRARRADSDEVMQSIWTIDRAKLLGLYPGTERSQWRRQPQAMLVARATAEAARWVAADAILGIPYSAEELIDQLAGEGEPLAIEQAPLALTTGDGEGPKRRTAQRKTRARPPALPTGPPGPTSPTAPAGEPERADLAHDEPPEPIRKPQLDRLHVEFRELGWNRATALDHIAGWVGRKVAKTSDLTPDEAHTVLDNLAALREIAASEPTGQAGAVEDVPLPDEPPAMISDAGLAAIAERLDLWIEHRDIDSLRDDDLRELLAELRTMRRQHRHDVALLTACRERAAQLDTDYRELRNRQPPEPERDGDREAAEAAHAAAEIDAP